MTGRSGLRAFGAERAVDMARHRAEAAWLAEELARRQLEIVAEPGKMGAGIGKHDGIVRQALDTAWASCPG